MAKDLIVKAMTPECRLSYPHLFKPQSSNPKNPPKFSVTLLIPKGTDMMGTTLPIYNADRTQVIKPAEPIPLSRLVNNAAIMKWGPKENWPPGLKKSHRDGDDPAVHTTKKGQIRDGYKGHWVFKADSIETNNPFVVDEKNRPITDASVIYPGCYVIAYVYAYAWTHAEGGEGVKLILNGIKKIRDGKAFGGQLSAEEVFGPISDIEDAASEVEEVDFM